jgi:hypothetical protein
MADDATDWKHVGLKVEQSQYDDWGDYLEESEHGSMSQFIRTAVEAYANGTNPVQGGSPTSNPQGSTNDERVSELVDLVTTMESRMEQLEDTVQEATEAMYEATKDIDLGPEVFDALPADAREAVTANELAGDMGIDARSARVTLERLRKNTPTVKRIDHELFDEQPEDIEAGEEHGYERDEPLWFKEA